MVFSDAHVAAFLHFSGDRNPLHADADYARLTPFGEIVVPGICVVLAALAQAPRGRFARIAGQFRQPIFMRRDYLFRVEDAGDVVTVQALKGSAVAAEIRFWRSSEEAPERRTLDAEEITFRQDAAPYAPDSTWLPRLLDLYGLQPGDVAVGQLSALAWASYFTGVVFPGTQALFSSIDILFQPNDATEPTLSLTDVTGTMDSRFQRTTVRGRATGTVAAVTLTAFVRPLPVTHSVGEIAAASDLLPARSPRTAVVTGGSRGLGNVLVRLLMHRGDRVAFIYRHGRAEAEAVAREASQHHRTVLPIQADLRSSADCDRVAQTITGAFGPIDLLVNNAAAPVRPERFSDQTLGEFEDFITRSIQTVAAPTQLLIPRMAPGGVVAMMSSEDARRPPASYAHYACAKNAVEGLARGLAADYPAIRFVIARPPRILTDQTNVPFSLESPASAVSIGAALVTYLEALPAPPPNLHEIDLEPMSAPQTEQPRPIADLAAVPSVVGQWVLTALLVWACVAGLSYNRWEPDPFRTAYRDWLGHYVAGQLTRAAAAPGPVCLLVGLSTTRSDFAPAILESGAQSFTFISAASAGGSIYGVDLILAMAEDLRVKPACVVLGLHTHLLKDRTLGLWPAGYLDVLSPRRTVEFIPREVPEERTRTLLEAARRAAWPGYRLAQQVNRLTRDGIYRAQLAWSWRTPLPRQEFERLPGDLLPFETFEPPVTRLAPDALPGYRRAIDEQRLLDPAIYGTPAHIDSLRRVLARSLQLAPVTVAVILPESRFAREQMSPLAEAPFQTVLREFAGSGLTVIDDRSTMPDDSFDIDFHLLPAPARTYSADFIRRVAPVLERRAPAAGRIVLAGQSNALFVRPYLDAAFTSGRIDGFAQDGSRIGEWDPESAYWKQLAPALHQPMRAFVWWQGESDYREPSGYLTALRAFIDRVRREANDPSLLVVLCRIVDDPTPGWSDIRRAQETLAATDPHIVLVSSDGLPKEHPDWPQGSAHLSPDGYRTMAQRVIDAIQ